MEVPLGTVASMVMGQAPAGKDCNKDGRGTPFVKAGEFGPSRPIIREWTTDPKKFAKATDVLVCVVGATCGKINLGADCAIGRSAAAIRPNPEKLDQFYLHYYLEGTVKQLRGGSVGSAQTVISMKMLSDLPIPLPPLEEQKRIVAVLDQAFAALDRARAQTEANLADAEAIISPLISTVLGQDDPPPSWERFRLDDIAELRGGYAFKSGQYTESGAFVLRTVNIANDGRIVRGNDKFIASETIAEYERFHLHAGDTLFVMVGATLGKAGYVTESDLPALLNQNMWVIRPLDDRTDPRFLHHLYKVITTDIVGSSRGAARSFVKRQDVRELTLHLPTIGEQIEIIERVEAAYELYEGLQSHYLQRLNDIADLRHSLLQKAFSGQLTA